MVFILLSPTPWEEIANTQHENPTPVPHTAARFARWDQTRREYLRTLDIENGAKSFQLRYTLRVGK